MSTEGQRTKWRRKIAENFSRQSRGAHTFQRERRRTDDDI